MIAPDVLRSLDTNGIAVLGQDLAAGKVAKDDVFDLVDIEANVFKSRGTVQTDDGGVGGDSDLVIASNLAFDVDNGSPICSSGLGELSDSGNGSCCSSLTSSGTAIGGGISDGAGGSSPLVVELMSGSRNGSSQRSKRRQGEGRVELHFRNGVNPLR